MAYTTVFTKESVKKINDNDYMLSVNVVVNDGISDILEKVYSVRYNIGWSIDDVAIKLYRTIKADWDKYSDEKEIFDRAAFNTMVQTIKTYLDNYINP